MAPNIPILPTEGESNTKQTDHGVQAVRSEPPVTRSKKPPDPSPLRRSKRTTTRPPSYKGMALGAWISTTMTNTYIAQPYARPDHKYMSFLLHDWTDETIDGIMPQEVFSYASKKNGFDPDMPPWHIAISGAQVDDWYNAADKEI